MAMSPLDSRFLRPDRAWPEGKQLRNSELSSECEQELRHQLDEAARTQTASALLLMEVTQFKVVRELYGDEAGNVAFGEFFLMLMKKVPAAAGVARFGEEEFAVVLPETDAADGLRLAKELKKEIENSRFEIDGTHFPGRNLPNKVRLTVAIGVAAFPYDSTSASGLLQAAGLALSEAKRSRGNRVARYSGANGRRYPYSSGKVTAGTRLPIPGNDFPPHSFAAKPETLERSCEVALSEAKAGNPSGSGRTSTNKQTTVPGNGKLPQPPAAKPQTLGSGSDLDLIYATPEVPSMSSGSSLIAEPFSLPEASRQAVPGNAAPSPAATSNLPADTEKCWRGPIQADPALKMLDLVGFEIGDGYRDPATKLKAAVPANPGRERRPEKPSQEGVARPGNGAAKLQAKTRNREDFSLETVPKKAAAAETFVQSGTRREQRLNVGFPVHISGMDVNGKMFEDDAATFDVTTTGARLGGFIQHLQRGYILKLNHRNHTARYVVKWVGEKGSAEEGQAGLQLIDQGKLIWGRALPRLLGDQPTVRRLERPQENSYSVISG